jgi:hypothetical protein
MASGCDWAHHEAIGGGGVAGGGSGERRWRGRGGAPAAARVPARLKAGKINARPWELLWGLGKRWEVLAGGGSERRCELTEAAAAMAGGGRRAHAREESEAATYSRARVDGVT